MISNQNISIENVCCSMGCPSGDDILFTGTDLLHNIPGEFNVVKCRTCGLMRTNLRPAVDSIGIYYPDDYKPYLSSNINIASPQKKSIIKKYLKPIINKLFDFKGKSLPCLEPGKMLEIGCASGAFLHEMSSQGWQVQGIEFSEGPAQVARNLGHSVYSGTLETAPRPETAPFDLIVGWMVLEHLHDPVTSLQKLGKWSKPDSWLVLSVPNAASLEFKLFKNRWYALQLPTHLHHFTPKSAANVLKKGGWILEKVHYQRSPNDFIASLGYVLRDRGLAKIGGKMITLPDKGGSLTYMLYPFSWLLSLVGLTGRMTLWARRKNT